MACIDLCKRQHVERNQAIHAWLVLWPKRCENCHGAGMFYHPGSFDYRAGVGEPPSQEPCEDCTAQGYCARCGLPGLKEDGEGPCVFCGWAYDDQEPEPHECHCWYVEEMAAEDALVVPPELDWQPHTFEPD